MNTAGTISRHGITQPMEQFAEFCRRWKVGDLAGFGSFLRDDFGPDSDLDFLYTFDDDVHLCRIAATIRKSASTRAGSWGPRPVFAEIRRLR
jgi:predicted nucleotidyltransferase